jgi:predicted Rossmann fold nucleotide-binding protein DprA/Smf involved in DNA uptake
LKECGWFEEDINDAQGILKLTDIEQLVYERLSLDAPVRQDILVEQLQLPPGKISHILLQLTLKGLIQDTGQAGFIRIIPTT